VIAGKLPHYFGRALTDPARHILSGDVQKGKPAVKIVHRLYLADFFKILLLIACGLSMIAALSI